MFLLAKMCTIHNVALRLETFGDPRLRTLRTLCNAWIHRRGHNAPASFFVKVEPGIPPQI